MNSSAQPVLDLLDGFRRSKVMFAAVEMEVFDRTPLTAAGFAEGAGADLRAATLLLDACVSLGLLTREGDTYTNTPEANAYLRRSSPASLAGYALYSNRVLWKLWDPLPDAVREGTHRWPQAFDSTGPIFSQFFRTGESMRTFLSGLHGLGLLCSPAVVRAHDLSAVKHLVDLGGGTGHLALAFLDAYPSARATVFDLAQVIPLTREFTTGRVECLEGDFFEDPLPAADAYSLARILHDWTAEKIARLLGRVYEALPPGGRLLIAEALIDEDRSGPLPAILQSVNMLTCTEGWERTAAEYEALCRNAGFPIVEARRTGTALDAVLAIK